MIAVCKSACSQNQDIHGPAQDEHYLQDPDSLLSFLLSVKAALSVEVLDGFLSR
jgi:hypothetical protein